MNEQVEQGSGQDASRPPWLGGSASGSLQAAPSLDLHSQPDNMEKPHLSWSGERSVN